MSSSLGNVAHCDTLIARELGSKSRPVETIHTASTFQFQNDLSFKDAEQTKLVIQKDGHLAVSQDVHLYDSTDIDTGNLRFSLGLSPDGSTFRIVNEQTSAIVFEAGDYVVSNWAVTATHNNLDQAITSSTNVTLSDGTVGTYNESLLFADHRIGLPLPGTITHFVTPQQPIFSFTQPTRVFMFIPTSTPVAPIRLEGWVYVPQGLSGSSNPFLNFPVPVLDELFSGVISSVDYDYCYEKFHTAGTYNLDPNALAPEAFYLFEELIDGNVLSELRQRQMYIFEEGVLPGAPGGNYGIGTNNPTAKLHVVGDIRASGSGNVITSGSIEAGKNADVISHFGRGRIGHFDITNPQTGATSSSVSFSHHDCSTGTNFSLLQTEDGETLLNSDTGKHTEFRLGGVEKMRLHTNGFLGINQQGPTQALDVGGNIQTTGDIKSTDSGSIIEVGKNTNGISHLNRARVESASFGPGSIVSFSHHDCQLGSNLALAQSDEGETLLNSESGKSLQFRIGGLEKMRVHSDGNVGIGIASPNYTLDVNGSFYAHTVETNRLYASAFNLSAISPDVWALAGDTTAYEGGGNITKSAAVSVKNLNGIPFWFFGDNDSDVTINNAITAGNTWTIAIAITKKPESNGVIFAQLPLSETAHGSENNHRIAWEGSINGDEYRPSGGGWSTGAYVSIPDESTLIVRRNGTGANSISVFLNGGLVYQTQYTEGYSGGTITKMRLGQINRYSNYQKQTPLYMGIAAVAAWGSPVSDNNIRKYVNYQSLTTKA